jgi:hypothetical protein
MSGATTPIAGSGQGGHLVARRMQARELRPGHGSAARADRLPCSAIARVMPLASTVRVVEGQDKKVNISLLPVHAR